MNAVPPAPPVALVERTLGSSTTASIVLNVGDSDRSRTYRTSLVALSANRIHATRVPTTHAAVCASGGIVGAAGTCSALVVKPALPGAPVDIPISGAWA